MEGICYLCLNKDQLQHSHIIPNIGSCKYAIPDKILEYLNERSNMAGQVLASISPNQASKISDMLWDKLDELPNSEVFRAMQCDVAFSGKKAFEITQPKKGNSEKGSFAK